MRRQLPDPRAIYDSRRRATADHHKRSALNAHLPDAGEALSQFGNVDPVAADAAGPRIPHASFVAEPMIALLGVEGFMAHAGTLISRLEALDASQAANEYFGDRRTGALALWKALDGKTDAKPEAFDELLNATLRAAHAWLPRDPDKAATPPAEKES